MIIIYPPLIKILNRSNSHKALKKTALFWRSIDNHIVIPKYKGFKMNYTRIAVVGCGFYAQNHLNAWNDLKDKGAKLVSVCDLDHKS